MRLRYAAMSYAIYAAMPLLRRLMLIITLMPLIAAYADIAFFAMDISLLMRPRRRRRHYAIYVTRYADALFDARCHAFSFSLLYFRRYAADAYCYFIDYF